MPGKYVGELHANPSGQYCTSLLHTQDFEQMNPTLALLCLGFSGGGVDGGFFVDFNFSFLFKFKH